MKNYGGNSRENDYVNKTGAAPKWNRAVILIFIQKIRYDPKDQKPIRLPAIQPVS